MEACPTALDGSFLILRLRSSGLEVITDAAASFTVWWCTAPIGTVVTTSQRIAIAALQSFMPDPQALTWFLVAGHLGLASSWDSRLQWVPPQRRVLFDLKGRIASSEAIQQRAPVVSLASAIDVALKAYQPVASRSVLTLSGGIDSLALGAELGPSSGVHAVTWGAVGDERVKGTDTEVAASFAGERHLPHQCIEQTPIDVEQALRRFAHLSEGRIDHVSGYLDGFQTWAKVRSLRRELVIRGDEGFGWIPIASDLDLRVGTRIPTYPDVGLDHESILGLENQMVMARWFCAAVPMATRRDEVYRAVNLPKVMAALSSSKSAFVETVNPFLSRVVLDAAAALPDSERTDKRAFRNWVRSRGGVQRTATRIAASTPPRELLGVLAAGREWTHVPASLRRWLPPLRLTVPRESPIPRERISREIKAALPASVRGWLRNSRSTRPIPTWRLWLRAWLAEEAMRTFRNDASMGQQ